MGFWGLPTIGSRMDRKLHYCIVWVALSLMLFSVHSQAEMCPVRKAVTYNTALLDMPLLPSLPNNRIERTYAIAKELERLNADVVCLQEVWIGEDVEFLTKSLQKVYPFSFSKLHYKGQIPSQKAPKSPPCNYMAVNSLAQCIFKNKCIRRGRSFSESYLCVIMSCFIQYTRLSQKCVSCSISGFTKPKETYAKCVGYGIPQIGVRDVNEPGLILLSKTPLTNTRYVDYHPKTKEVIERGFLEADSPDLGKLVCTHIACDGRFYYEPELWVNGDFNSYIEQGDFERGQLIDRFRHVSPLLLMGDFNVGDVTGPQINPVIPKEFRRLSVFFDVIPLKMCSLCARENNPYHGTSEIIRDTVVDHVFHRGHKVKDVIRVFTPLDAILMSGFPLSDHYGVMAIIEMC